MAKPASRRSAPRRQAVGTEPDLPELVIGLAAAVGTPLDLIQTLLTEHLEQLGYGTEVLHLSDYTRRFRLTSPPPTGRAREAKRIDAMMNRGNEARSRTGRNDILALCAIADIRSRREDDASALPKQAFVLRQLKHPDEVYLLRRTYGDGFHLLGLYCPRRAREEHLRTRGANHREIERLILRDENEPSESGQHLRDTFHLSDVFLEISDQAEPVEDKLQRFFRLLFGDGVISPTIDEFGMFHAQAAALRSAQLGRQVGAAILSKRGDVIATGTNDVPRSGGGLYWEHDENDSRDHVRGRDSTDEAEEHLMQELTERLHPEWAGASPSKRRELTREYASKLKSSSVTSLTEFGRAVHAEAEALLSAARMGVSPRGALLFCTTFPCHVCARHIVAAGVHQVTYIEPYPKSRALELHDDSISIEEDQADRVVFKPFVGVAPRRFARLFSMVSEEGAEIRRKDAEGRLVPSTAGLRLRLPYFSALDREKLAAEELENISTD